LCGGFGALAIDVEGNPALAFIDLVKNATRLGIGLLLTARVYTHDYKWPVFVAAASSVMALGAVMRLRAEEPHLTSEPQAAEVDTWRSRQCPHTCLNLCADYSAL
jgi:hypothetical protein